MIASCPSICNEHLGLTLSLTICKSRSEFQPQTFAPVLTISKVSVAFSSSHQSQASSTPDLVLANFSPSSSSRMHMHLDRVVPMVRRQQRPAPTTPMLNILAPVNEERNTPQPSDAADTSGPRPRRATDDVVDGRHEAAAARRAVDGRGRLAEGLERHARLVLWAGPGLVGHVRRRMGVGGIPAEHQSSIEVSRTGATDRSLAP